MSLFDAILIPFYLILVFMIGFMIRNRHKDNPVYTKWFMKGLAVKALGALAFALVYTFYYDYGGDTRSYFEDALRTIDSLKHGPGVFFEVLNHSYNNVSSEALDYLLRMNFSTTQELAVVDLSVPFVILGLGSYFSANILIGLFTYWGVWKLFLLFIEKYPQMQTQMAIAVLFVPSVFFWGSGISKDSFVLCFLGLILYHFNRVLSGRFWSLKSLLIIAVTAYLILIIKSYVLFSIIPAALLWRTLYIRDRIRSGILRAVVLPFVLVAGLAVVIFSMEYLSSFDSQYSAENFVSSAQSMQGWHYREGQNTSEEHGRGSSYTLGEYNADSYLGLLKIAPAAVNVTFFRPYFWEVENAGMLAQALESFFYLLVTVVILLRVGPFRVYSYISGDSFLLMCVLFSLFFGFAVGFSSYNFGALSRYKIPCIPFFVAALFIIHHKYQSRRQGRRVG